MPVKTVKRKPVKKMIVSKRNPLTIPNTGRYEVSGHEWVDGKGYHCIWDTKKDELYSLSYSLKDARWICAVRNDWDSKRK